MGRRWRRTAAVGLRGRGRDSVYVARRARGTGAGRVALEGLCRAYAERGFWKIVSRIFPENTGSLRLHGAAGSAWSASTAATASWTGEWRDCVIVEKLLER